MHRFWHSILVHTMLSSARHLGLSRCMPLYVILLIWVQTRADAVGTIKVGALLATESRFGREAQRALRLALQNINNDSTILNGTVLDLVVANINCSALQGVAAAIELFGENVVAIAGPQTSVASHFVTQMGAACQIPLVSFSATDPSLSEYQYSYFVRLAHSDRLQMDAIAHIIHLYGWSEVVTLYSKDLETGSIEALDDSISGTGIRIVQKEGLDPDIDRTGIVTLLAQLTQLGSRIYVVHMPANLSRSLFIEAYNLGMMSSGFVWIVTEETASILDTIFLDDDFVKSIQGLIGIRSYIPKSSQLELFMTQWKNSVLDETNTSKLAPISSYGLYAYDSLWTIAKAIDKFLDQNPNVTFLPSRRFSNAAGEHTDLAKLKIFQNGSVLLQAILGTNFTGITGNIEFNNRGDLRGSALEVVNMVGKDAHTVGYWTTETGLPSSSKRQGPPTVQKSNNAETLDNIVWPGGSNQVPRGWIFPSGKPLLIAVPNKQGYKEFVDVQRDAQNITTVTGFCIDVFVAACQLLPYYIDYNFVPFGNGNQTPNYDELVQTVASEEFDAVVGDVTITTNRSKYVDFTQPYAESGLVVLVPTKQTDSNQAWNFIQPFTAEMWLTTLLFFLFSGLVVWVLEHKKNDEFRGNPKKQIVNSLWFIFSTLFFAQKEEVKSTLAKFVVIIWMFVVLILTSSYTASLTSNLTVQHLLPTIQNIGDLLASNVKIGFQAGSFVHDYLMIQLSVSESRLIPLNSIQANAAALKNGIVGAIVDELPYVQLFLSSQCGFTIAGQEFTKGGFGFAFPKGSQLARDLSTAILQLSESGKLQKIHDFWLEQSICTSVGLATNSNELGVNAFRGLFLITGVTSILCCILYCARLLRRFILTPRTYPAFWESMPPISRGAYWVRSFFLFVGQKEELPSRSINVNYITSFRTKSFPSRTLHPQRGGFLSAA